MRGWVPSCCCLLVSRYGALPPPLYQLTTPSVGSLEQVVLQPQHSVQVQVVCGLIQQQQVCENTGTKAGRIGWRHKES